MVFNLSRTFPEAVEGMQRCTEAVLPVCAGPICNFQTERIVKPLIINKALNKG